MKLNRTIVLSAIIAGGLFAANSLPAQDAPMNHTNHPPLLHPGGAGRPDGMRQFNPEKIAKDLDLSDEQKPKFKAVMEDARKQMTDLRADTSLSQTDKRAKGKALREATNNKMKEILTPDQYEKYLKLAPGGPRNRPAPGADAPPAVVPPPTAAPAKN